MGNESIKQEFLRPSDEFTPIPFWFWNDYLSEEEIGRQIREFYNKGVMGFVIHPRKGLPKEITYLSDKYMHYVKYAVQEAKELGMKVVLYDEAMYPSGSAHGKVVESNPDYASKCLRVEKLLSPREETIYPKSMCKNESLISVLALQRSPYEENTYIFETAKVLNPIANKYKFDQTEGEEWDVFFFIESFSGGTIRGVHEGEDDGEEFAPKAADLLNPKAVDAFINITYEAYYQVLKEYFGTTIIAMFTDEPDILGRCHKENVKPWTSGFLEFYLKCGGKKEDLAALWFDIGEQTEEIRRKFKKAINKKMRQVYYGKLSDWCLSHNIALTGHPEQSYDIGMLDKFQIPGQDLVWRMVGPEDEKGIKGKETVMAKCSSDAARHRGCNRNANECFGCCGPDGNHWAFSMDDMKWYMDWLFVRGVNLLFPHAFYYSIDGEIRYGERPPDVGIHNIWWKYYEKVSTYIKRLSWLMSGSHNTTPFAVLCEEDNLPWKMVEDLYQDQIEFNYLEKELLLSDKCKILKGSIGIQNQNYRYLLVEDKKLLTQDLKDKLKPFIENGGSIILSSDLNVSLLEKDAVITPANKDLRISHVIKNGLHFYLLVNEGENTIKGEIAVPIQGLVEIWNPWTGTITSEKNVLKELSLNRRESLILCIDPCKKNKEELSNKKIEINKWKIGSKDREIDGKLSLQSKELELLDSWTNWPQMENVTGTVFYEAEILEESLNQIYGERESTSLWLDLEEVHELAHVYINGQDCGCCLWAPYIFEISNYIGPGRNVIRVEVTNTMANSKSHEKRLSGLLGPITIYSKQ